MRLALVQCCKIACSSRLLQKLPKGSIINLSARMVSQDEWLAKFDILPKKKQDTSEFLQRVEEVNERNKTMKSTSEENRKGHIMMVRSEEGEEEEEESTLGVLTNYDLSDRMVTQLQRNGIKHLFEVQYETFDHIKDGKDAIVQARTGTGKTLAFVLPILERLEDNHEFRKSKTPKVLALAPTRELAVQTSKEFEKFKSRDISVSCFYGGVSMERQENDLEYGIDVLVGTPGRILDHIKRENLDISCLEHVVLDEADRMLDMGFQKDIDAILSHAYTKANKPQTLLFSATIPPWVKQATRKYTDDGLEHFNLIGGPVQSAVKVQHQSIMCNQVKSFSLIRDLIHLHCGNSGKTIVFTPTKQEAFELSKYPMLNINKGVLHGDISQHQREKTLKDFRDGVLNCLVATDVAARGLDIPEIDLVIQTAPPQDTDNYIHRAGRTGRAGKDGLSIVLYGRNQKRDIQNVERRAGIVFLNKGPPALEEIIDHLAEDLLQSLSKIKEKDSRHFISAAQTLIENQGAENALASALALLSGRAGTDAAEREERKESYNQKRIDNSRYSTERGGNYNNRGSFSNRRNDRNEFSRDSFRRDRNQDEFYGNRFNDRSYIGKRNNRYDDDDYQPSRSGRSNYNSYNTGKQNRNRKFNHDEDDDDFW